MSLEFREGRDLANIRWQLIPFQACCAALKLEILLIHPKV